MFGCICILLRMKILWVMATLTPSDGWLVQSIVFSVVLAILALFLVLLTLFCRGSLGVFSLVKPKGGMAHCATEGEFNK